MMPMSIPVGTSTIHCRAIPFPCRMSLTHTIAGLQSANTAATDLRVILNSALRIPPTIARTPPISEIAIGNPMNRIAHANKML